MKKAQAHPARAAQAAAAIALLLPLLLGRPASGQSESSAGEAYEAGRFVVTPRLSEGTGTLTIVAILPDRNHIEVEATVAHVREKPEGSGAVDNLDYATTGVKAGLRVVGRGVRRDPREPAEVSQDSGHTDPATRRSEVKILWKGELDPSSADVERPLTAVVRITEPHGSARVLAVPMIIPTEAAACHEELARHPQADAIRSELEGIEKGIAERRAKIREGVALKDRIETDLRQAEDWLDRATDFLEIADKALRGIDRALEGARTWEDRIGWIDLLLSLGKPGLKALLTSDAACKFLAKNPERLMHLRRLLPAHGAALPASLLEASQKLDQARQIAVRDTMNELIQAARGRGKDLEFKMSGSSTFKFPRGEEGLLKIADDMPQGRQWRGLESDVDIEFADPRMAQLFEKRIIERLNDGGLLEGAGFKKLDDAGALRMNTFVGNLSDIDLRTPEGLARWKKELLAPRYLSNPDAFRTFGGQRLAAYYNKVAGQADPLLRKQGIADLAIARLDGYEIAREMAARAETIWRTKNRVDPKVLKDIKKQYERAILGQHIALGKSIDVAEKLSKENPLVKEVEELLRFDGTRPPPNLPGLMRRKAEELMERIRAADGELGKPPPVDSAARRSAHALGMSVLEAEPARRAVRYLASPAARGTMASSFDQAQKQWTKDIRLHRLLDAALSNRSAGIGLSGLIDWLGNPYASTVKGWALLIMEPGERDQAEARHHVGNAAKALASAEARFLALEKLLRSLGRDFTRSDLLRALRGLPDDAKDCFEEIVKVSLTPLETDLEDLTAFVKRIRYAREELSTEQMLDALDEALGDRIEEAQKQADALRRRRQEHEYEIKKRETRSRPAFLEREIERHRAEIAKIEPEEEAAKAMLAELRDLGRTGKGRGRLAALVPDSLRFSDLSQALLDFRAENERGAFSGQGLASYCMVMREVLRGIRLSDPPPAASRAQE